MRFLALISIIIYGMEQFLYETILREFYKNKVKYLIVGGIALNLHGVPRATFDLDILIDWDKKNLSNITDIFNRLGFKSTAPIKLQELLDAEKRKTLMQQKHMFAINFYNEKDPLEEVDILIKSSDEFNTFFKRRNNLKVEDFEVYLISLDDLIKLKKSSRRNKDREDIKSLMLVKRLSKNDTD